MGSVVNGPLEGSKNQTNLLQVLTDYVYRILLFIIFK